MNLGINRITNANVYVNGVDLLGRCEEVDLPQPKSVMVEHNGLGMFGKAELPAGLDKLEAKFKWASLYTEVLSQAFKPMDMARLMVRANMQQFTSGGLAAEVPVIAMVNGFFSEMPGFNVRRHANSEVPSSMSVHYYLLNIAGVDHLEIDVQANIFKVMGVDQLLQFRANLGG
jgi:uncharacterized protein